uniref:Putative ixodes 10 kDa peptide protein n=1 Tax=Ixodes ricinus TaxID=34613 RepID=A0A0K8RI85_IXORI
MYRNISNMLFVFFAVVLILPAFQGEEFLSGTLHRYYCASVIDPAGKIFCELHGSEDLNTYLLTTCEVTCRNPDKKLQLPNDVCPQGTLTPCTENVKTYLQKWKAEMVKTKRELIEKWCSGSREK